MGVRHYGMGLEWGQFSLTPFHPSGFAIYIDNLLKVKPGTSQSVFAKSDVRIEQWTSKVQAATAKAGSVAPKPCTQAMYQRVENKL